MDTTHGEKQGMNMTTDKAHSCDCGPWGMHKTGGHYILRLILIIILVMLVFSFGEKIGEMKGQIEGAYGYGSYSHNDTMMMRGTRGMMMPAGTASGTMMQPGTTMTTPAVPAAGAPVTQ